MSLEIVQSMIKHVRNMADYYEDKEQEAATLEKKMLWRGKKQAAESFLSSFMKYKLKAMRESSQS